MELTIGGDAMRTQRRLGQQRKDWVAIGSIAIVLLGVLAFIFASYWFGWSWTGLPNKGLWDWLQLLIIPGILALGGFWLNRIQKDRDRKAEKAQVELERANREDNQREATLQAYIDKMSELLLKEHLGELPPEGDLKPEYEKVRKIAQVRTLIVLQRLDVDVERKGSVLRFLLESDLLYQDKPNMGLRRANLSGVDLSKVNLRGVNLCGVALPEADLRGANFYRNVQHIGPVGALDEADLSEASEASEVDLSEVFQKNKAAWRRVDLSKVNLRGADLSGADLSGANLTNTILIVANLSGAILFETTLSAADLRNAHLSEAFLSKADLSGAALSGADLSRADLSYANLSRATSYAATLTDANLIRANLSGAHLSGANLSGANLSGANLSGADLSGADLKDATGITVGELEKQAKSLQGATMPNGSKRP